MEVFKHFWHPSCTKFMVAKLVSHNFKQQSPWNLWEAKQKLRYCEATVFTNLLINFGEKIVCHNARASTPLFIMHVGSAIFKPDTPFSHWTFIHYVVAIHFAQLPMNFYRFFANKNRITDRTSQLAGFEIAAHILHWNIGKTGSAEIFSFSRLDAD